MSQPPDTPESPREPERIEAEAAAWLSLRDRGMSAEETATFMRWLQEAPEHAAVFARLAETWETFDRLAVAAPATAAPDPDLLAPRPRRRRPRWPLLATAAAVALGLAFAYFHVQPFAAPLVETAVGAYHKLDLPDGSVAQLNTDSALAVAFTAGERRVRLVRGEVYFAVAKDAARPFIVEAGPVAVRAVGTAFNVHQREGAIDVLVAEGRVQIAARADDRRPAAPAETAPLSLGAGEQARVPPAEGTAIAVRRLSGPDVRRALAWQERRLEFDAAPLGEVAREFNRYNRRQLVVPDATLATRRFSGTFRADAYEAFVQLLESDFGVQAARTEREIVLQVRR